MGDELIIYSPFLFVAMALYIFLELLRINIYVNRWELVSLMVIPIMLTVLYTWIGLTNPSIEMARIALRCVICSSLGITCRVVYSYSNLLRKGGSI